MERISNSVLDQNKYEERFEDIAQRKQTVGVDEKIASIRSEDELFVSVLLNSLSKIEEGEAKEALKLEIQNLVFRTRFGPQRLLGSSSEVPASFSSDYYTNGMYRAAHEFGTDRTTLSDEELSMTNRRKAINPKRSLQSDNIKDSCSMVSVQQRHMQNDRGDI